jgi:hypothetical protein
MGFATAAGAVIQAGGAYSSAKSKKSAFNAQAQIDTNNAQVAEWQAQQAELAGADAEQSSRLRTSQVTGEQRAALAANGVDLGTGSATDVLAGTQVIGNHDALTIRDNASRQAWGYRTQGVNFLNDAAMSHSAADSINPALSAVGSLLSSAGAVDKAWTDSQKNKTAPAKDTPMWSKAGGVPSWMGGS